MNPRQAAWWFALLLPAAACADPLTARIVLEAGWDWWAVVTVAIVLIEWPIFVLVGMYRWGWGLLWAALANVASGLLGILIGPASSGPVVMLPLAIVSEGLILWGLVSLVPPRDYRPDRLLYAVIAMNIATFWISPAVGPRLTNMAEDQHRCLRNEKQLGVAMLAYAQDHEGFLPPATTTLALGPAVSGYLRNDDLLRCPAPTRWGMLPERRGTVNYQLVLPLSREPMSRWPQPERHLLLMDDAPRHNHGRNCLFYDGHVQWLSESRVQEALTKGNLHD